MNMRYGDKRRRSSFSPVAFGVMLPGSGGCGICRICGCWKTAVATSRHSAAGAGNGPGLGSRCGQFRHSPLLLRNISINPATGMAAFQDVPQSQVKKDLLTGTARIGQTFLIVSRLKTSAAGQPFVESDFLPKGTVPGAGRRRWAQQAGANA